MFSEVPENTAHDRNYTMINYVIKHIKASTTSSVVYVVLQVSLILSSSFICNCAKMGGTWKIMQQLSFLEDKIENKHNLAYVFVRFWQVMCDFKKILKMKWYLKDYIYQKHLTFIF